MRADLAQTLAAAMDRMPAFPHSVQRVLALTRDMQCSPRALVHVVENDPLMAVRVLRVVNSAYYGLPQKVTSIGHAVVYLGLNTIKNLALGIAAIGVLPKVSVGGFDSHQYLLHSLSTAGISKQLAVIGGGVDPMDAFIAGLLHDFGKVVFAQHFPREFSRALEYSQWHETSLHTALQEVMGIDHAKVGAMLLQRWNFAPSLIEAVGCQSGDPEPRTMLALCVFTANQVSKQLQLGSGGNPYIAPLPAAAMARFGGDLDAVIARLGDVHALLEQLQVFTHL